MKVEGNGKAKIIKDEELQKLFTEGLIKPRDRAMFAICLFAGCRVSECLALKTSDIKDGTITFRKSITKGNLRTRTIDINPALAKFLNTYQPIKKGALFPGMHGKGHLSRYMADRLLKAGCNRVGLEGVSTHSFRRTALTKMSNAGVPLRHIQEISGHADMGALQQYLDVSPEQRKQAVSAISW